MTDLSVIVAGVETALTDEAPFWVESIEGADAAPLHRLLERGPQQHGDSDAGFRLDPREIELVIGFRTTGLSDASRRSLLAPFKPRNTAGIFRAALDTGLVLQIDWHAARGPLMPRRGRDLDVQRAAVVLRCADPRFYDPDQHAVDFGLGGGGDAFEVPLTVPVEVGASTLDQSIVITYAGDLLEHPTVIVTGPIDDCVITNETTGETLDFTGLSLGAGETRTLDLRYGYKTVVDELGANALADLTDASDLATFHLAADPDAPGGNNSLRVTGSAVTTATAVRMRYYDRYSGF